jgi:sn-glycerol 3-phosphate transport system substrate-binding protein
MRPEPWTATIAGLALLVVACGGGGDGGGGTGSGAADATAGELPECPLEALDEATRPVEITLWHGLQRELETTLQDLTEQFDSSQDRVEVRLVNNADQDQHEKFLAGLTSGDVPDVLVHQESYLRQMVDVQAVLPAQSCIDAAGHDMSDHLERARAFYEVEGVQWALPFAVTNPVLLYNRNAFVDAGLDPDEPPSTLEGFRDAAQAIKDAGYDHGVALAREAWHFEELVALQGETYVDNGNGRRGRATEVTFDSEVGRELFGFLAGLVENDLAVTNPREGPDAINNLLAVGNGTAGMTIVSSSALGSVLQVLGTGQYADIDIGIAPLPGRDGDGGVVVGGSGLYITATEPAKQAAAWEYITFLTSTESQATWSARTGYVPVRSSSVERPEVQQRWDEVPGFRTAYDQLAEGAENDATAGAVYGDSAGVRAAVEDAMARMLVEGMAPDDALAQAARDANQAIAAYEERLGP